MPIGVNESTKQVVGALWTGIANMQVVAVSPTHSEMKAIGMNPTKEPEYKGTKEKDGKSWETTRIDVYLVNTVNKIRAKVAFWLENTLRANKDGTSFQFTNNYGQFTWPKKGEVEPNYEWFKKDGLRKAYVGEEALMSFLRALANVNPNDVCSLDTLQDILTKADVTELQNITKSISKNEVQCLLGVKDGQYQDVYTKYFERPYRKNFEPWKKALEGEYGEFKSDYQGDLHLKPYEGKGQVAMDSPTTMNGAPTVGAPKYAF